jgi:thiamine biosynthesis lipoprotein
MKATLSLLSLLLAFTAATAADLERFEFARLRMGTSVRIVLYAPDEASARAASGAAYSRIDEIESMMSHYREDSELSRLSASSGSGAKPVSPELFKILRIAGEFSARSGGAFDVTVGPLIELWRHSRRTKQLPTAAARRDATKRVGHRLVILDQSKSSAELRRKGMKLDLSAIAKGYAADEALRILKAKGCPAALLDAGGDIAVGEAPPGKKGWTVAIDAVPGQPGTARRTVVLAKKAIATSGDAYQFVEIGGERYSHIVDPKTGLGVRGAASATVIARDCLTADALATSLCVLSPREGLRLVESTAGASARILRQTGDGVEQFVTGSFPP